MRITCKKLREKCAELNRLSLRPMTYYDRGLETYSMGHYYIDSNITGYTINEVMDEGGGINAPFGWMRISAREMYYLLEGAIWMAKERHG